MAEDYIIEEKEQEALETQQRNHMKEAAIFVTEGFTREEAIEKVKDIHNLRIEAEISGEVVRDEDGIIEEYLDSELEIRLKPASVKTSQIKAIQKELCESEGIPLR